MSALRHLGILKIAVLFAALLSALTVASLPARAQELSPEHIALARKYIDLSLKITMFEQALIQAGIDVSDTIQRVDPSLEEKADKAIGDAIGYFAGKKDDVFNQFARVYALQFTMDELREMNAFYETPTGQKLAGLQSAIAGQIASLFALYEENMRNEMYARVRADLIEQGADL